MRNAGFSVSGIYIWHTISDGYTLICGRTDKTCNSRMTQFIAGNKPAECCFMPWKINFIKPVNLA
ncbi:MAG: hypothetical protein DRH32_05060 [Deltaproteobacteria bacterium]|nr:MAG: hypothetical protein DRH32_05060 [Deltaproteobacteria bacterium]